MSEAKAAAVYILGKWIDYASSKGNTEAAVAFWYARDVIEGVLKVPKEKAAAAVAYIKTCKASQDRETILAALAESEQRQ